jgi:subtilase family serine protease
MTSPDTQRRPRPAAAGLSRQRYQPGKSAAAWLGTAGLLLAGAGCAGGRPVTVPGALARPGTASDCLAQELCYTPLQFRTAYGVQPLVQRGVNGHGQTVVLIELPAPGSTSLRQDIARYDARFGLPTAAVRVTAGRGSQSAPRLAGGEEVEDAETVHAIAPGAAIRILDISLPRQPSPAQLAAALTAGLRRALLLGSVISISASFGENCFTRAQDAELNAALQAAADHHVTVVAASGDYGVVGKPCGTGSFIPARQVNLPAADPLVLAVGGTRLQASRPAGAYAGETAWNNRSPPGQPPGATGGGFSRVFPRPAYQTGVPGIGAGRGVPDVSANADPGTGLALLFATATGANDIVTAGGTSAAAPLWAALIAIGDQYARRSLGSINPAIYQIGESSGYHQAFHEVTRGTNTVTFSGKTFTGYTAGAGWNPVTGWGTPDAQYLIPLLATFAASSQSP